jgi:ribosomal protein S18 acetylase RimI-like enzyme
MKSDILIRDAAYEELDKIDQMVKRAYQEYERLLPDHAWEAWMDSITEAILSYAGMLLVADHEGEMRGAVKFYPDATHAAMGNWPSGSALIRILAVEPKYRGRGYGTLLTLECLRRARDLKIPTIFLYTGKFMLAAQHIYEKLGFRRAPEFEGHPGPIAYRLDLPESESQ